MFYIFTCFLEFVLVFSKLTFIVVCFILSGIFDINHGETSEKEVSV